MASESDTSSGRRWQLDYTPALDGLRGFALVAILVYHQDSHKLPGAWLSVSLFFTLSGFLIGTLLLQEYQRSDRIDLPRFYERRLRRLVPASLIALGMALLVTVDRQPGGFRSALGDIVAALAQVANWRFVVTDFQYASADGGASPVQHYWSLAIEEQFYLVVPVLVLVAMRRRFFPYIAGGIVVASTLAQFRFTTLDRLYFGTDTRAAEIGAGLLLAWFWPSIRSTFTRHPAVGDVLGLLAVVVTAVLWTTVDLRSSVLRTGLLTACSGVWIAWVVASMSGGRVAKALSWRPLSYLGKISYGVYLYHWPVYLMVLPGRVPFSGWALLGARVGVSVALAALSYHLVEMPIRSGRFRLRLVGPALAVGAASIVGAAAVLGTQTFVDDSELAATLVAPPPVSPTTVAAAAPVQSNSAPTTVGPTDTGPPRVPPSTITPTSTVPSSPPTAVAPQPRAPRLLILGDSTARATGLPLQHVAAEDGVAEAYILSNLGCTILQQDEMLAREDAPFKAPCRDIIELGMEAARDVEPDAIVVFIGSFQVADAKYPGMPGGYLPFLTPTVTAAYEAAVDEAMSTLSAVGVPVLWADLPVPAYDLDRIGGVATGTPGHGPCTCSDPVGTEQLNALTAAAASRYPLVETWPYAAAIGLDPVAPSGPDPRSDGLHLRYEEGRDLARENMLPRLFDSYATVARRVPSADLTEPTTWDP